LPKDFVFCCSLFSFRSFYGFPPAGWHILGRLFPLGPTRSLLQLPPFLPISSPPLPINPPFSPRAGALRSNQTSALPLFFYLFFRCSIRKPFSCPIMRNLDGGDDSLFLSPHRLFQARKLATFPGTLNGFPPTNPRSYLPGNTGQSAFFSPSEGR